MRFVKLFVIVLSSVFLLSGCASYYNYLTVKQTLPLEQKKLELELKRLENERVVKEIEIKQLDATNDKTLAQAKELNDKKIALEQKKLEQDKDYNAMFLQGLADRRILEEKKLNQELELEKYKTDKANALEEKADQVGGLGNDL